MHSSSIATTSSAQPGLLFSAEPGAWDAAGVGHPIVRYYLGDNEQRWYMWYSGRSEACPSVDDVFPSSGSVGVAISSDGVHWLRSSGIVDGVRGPDASKDVGKCMSPNKDWWWHDTMHLHATDVQILSNSSVASNVGVYWMFYSGGSFEETKLYPNSEAREGLKLRPGLAMSQDGRNWARIEAEHHTGALFDVGEIGEWDELFVAAPQVVTAGPRDLRMYYHSYDAEKKKYRVGLATSLDGFKWDKCGPIFDGGGPGDFDELGVTNRCVVRDIDSKNYFMFYEGVAADGSRSIGLAVSEDGKTRWERHPLPVLVPASQDDNAWDGGSVGTPWAVSMAAGKWRLYYSGRNGHTESKAWNGIGLALSVDDASQFRGAPTVFKRRMSKG